MASHACLSHWTSCRRENDSSLDTLCRTPEQIAGLPSGVVDVKCGASFCLALTEQVESRALRACLRPTCPPPGTFERIHTPDGKSSWEKQAVLLVLKTRSAFSRAMSVSDIDIFRLTNRPIDIHPLLDRVASSIPLMPGRRLQLGHRGVGPARTGRVPHEASSFTRRRRVAGLRLRRCSEIQPLTS